MNPWLIFSLAFLIVWLVFYLIRKDIRKEMLWASILTAPLGLTEPLFVPEYWNPPSLFNLAARTGFDIESLIFCFALGGIGASLYEFVFKTKHQKTTKHEMHKKRHRFHKLILISPLIVFLPLYIFTNMNPIYSASISMFIGAIATLFCRPDLKNKTWIGGLLFLSLYFIFFFLFIQIYPSIINEVWNLEALSGILILKIPIEEFIFAFTFGMLWSSYYEHINWIK